MTIHRDCRSYRGDRPCDWHKVDGRACGGCPDYDPVEQHLLVIKTAALGDVLRTTAILPALEAAYPRAHVTWLTSAAAAPLLEGNRLIDRIWTLDQSLLLLAHDFDASFCLDGDPVVASLHHLARSRRRFGFTADSLGRVSPASDEAEHWWRMGLSDTLKRANRKSFANLMCDMCGVAWTRERPQLALADGEREWADSLLAAIGVDRSMAVVGVNTGGGSRWQHKKWTESGYSAVLRLIAAKRPDVEVVLLGGPEERGLNARLLASAPASVRDGGCDHTPRRFASIIDRLTVLVTSDSLALHMATALERPVIALVGPTSPWELDVFGSGDVLHGDVDCLACYRATCDKAVTCMDTLAPERVFESVQRFLPRPTGSTRAMAAVGFSPAGIKFAQHTSSRGSG